MGRGASGPGSVLRTLWSVSRTSEGAGDTVLSLGCTEVMAVPQEKRKGPRAPERDQEGWPPACDEASVSTSLDAGCSQDSILTDTGDRGDWTLPKGGGGSCSGTAPRRGPGPGRVLAVLGSLRRAFSGS